MSYYISIKLQHLQPWATYCISSETPVSEPFYLQWATTSSTISDCVCLQWAIPLCKWVIISSMSHNIFNNSFYLKWAITFSIIRFISSEPSHFQWATTSPMNHPIFIDPFSLRSHHNFCERLYVQQIKTSSIQTTIILIKPAQILFQCPCDTPPILH